MNDIVRVKLQSQLNGFSSVIDCILTEQITERLPTSPINRKNIRIIPHNIKLADPEFHKCADINVLIGVELFWELMCIGRVNSCKDYPRLQNTHLG